MRNTLTASILALALASSVCAAEKYNGPRPPKQDVPYLVHADNLIETEVSQASPESRKHDTTYVISGTNSPARTPLAEPIFLIDANTIVPERLEMYRMEVKNGRREITLSGGRHGSGKPIHITVTPLGDHLYRVEAAEMLEDGEYVLTPNGSNQVFCFEIY
ncbi:MAG TPA: hypothetical protein VKV15_22145 [Bryobacteraceae bacterium]|nr:hypothetical protein [Bryobacteraceae bacterium]